MNSLFSASTTRSVLVGWIIPSLIAVSVGSFFLLPAWEEKADFAQQLAAMDWPERAALLIGSALILGFMLNSWQGALYRLLEGYPWPSTFRHRRSEAHRRMWKDLKAKYDKARDRDDRWAMAKYLEQLRRYPDDLDEFMPSALGNAIRAAEYYSWERYRIDIINLWYHLSDHASQELREDEARSRSAMDFQVCFLYLSLLFSGLAILTVGGMEMKLSDAWLLILVPIFLSALFYRGAVVAALEWRKSITAIADTSRRGLAAALDLELPRSLEIEREMWRVVGQVLKYPYTKKRSTDLQPYRG